MISVLKSKIHRAVVTDCDLNYEGSISVDEAWLKLAEIREYEQVDVLNITNGNRFTTYAIKAEKGAKKIGINGAAARLATVGDLVIILSYRHIEEKQTTPKPIIFIPEHYDKV